MRDPYEILGVDKNATQEEMTAAYQSLKAKYGEGRFVAGEAGMQAARDLNDLENAWLDIQQDLRMRETAQRFSAEKGDEEIPELKAEEGKKEDAKTAEALAYVEKLIADKKYDEAQKMLDDLLDRGGEWHYLQSKIYYQREWIAECRKQLVVALACDPDNAKYKAALDKLDMIVGNKNTNPDHLNQKMDGRQDAHYQNQNADMGGSLVSCCVNYCLCSMCMDLCCRC